MNLNKNIIKKTYLFFISFLFIFFSCNSDDDHKTPADKKKDAFVTVTGVNLDKEELSLEVGAESTLIATVTPTTATNKKVTWSSDKTDIATVANGLVTAVAVGTATITVTASADNTKTDTVTVTVTESAIAVTGVTLDKEELSLEVGAESTLIATVTPTTATNKKVSWASDKPNIATVANGLVTAVAVGTATITVTTSADNTKTDTVTVTVTESAIAVTGVTLDKEELSLEVGAESTLIATVTPTTATNKEVTWASDKPNIATVDNGLVTAVAVGTATITVTTSADNTKTDTVTVTVTSTLTEFSIADIRVTSGTTSFDISPTLTPTEATADYELITKPTGVTMAGTTINIVDMADGEYEITVKAKGTGNYIGEIETTFTLYLGISLNDDFVINFRDEEFKKKVKSYYSIRAKDVTYRDVKDRTKLSAGDNRIANMEEIKYFTSLEELYCYDNQLTSLDLSQNTALTYLHCKNNKLTSLNLSKNTNLKILYCQENQLTSLDLSQNTVLERLDCSNNKFTSLDISKNTVLDKLDCSDNKLTSLDISKNTVLKILYCQENQLTSLDISKNTVLGALDCSSNQLTSLDIRQNTSLTALHCYDNPLTSLDISKNTVLKGLVCSSNQLTSLDISKNTVLKQLSCSNNQLTSLDISKNTFLTVLYCRNNQLTSLDLTQNTNLEMAYCSSNPLTSLDLSQNTVLEKLDCSNNPLTSLDLSQNTALKELYCKENQLTSLDIRGMRWARFLNFNNTTLLETLKIHQNIKNNRWIIDFKTTRGSNLTISTYSATAGSTTYELICSDYVPATGGGTCND